MRHCGHCHECGTKLHKVLDGEEWCPTCEEYKRYRSHGWTTATLAKRMPHGPGTVTCTLVKHQEECPEIQASSDS